MNPHLVTPTPSQFSMSPNGRAKIETRPEKGGPSGGGLPYQRSVAKVHAMSILSPDEQKEFAECEAAIEKGWQTFVIVGQALARIRDQKFYRYEFNTFEA